MSGEITACRVWAVEGGQSGPLRIRVWITNSGHLFRAYNPRRFSGLVVSSGGLCGRSRRDTGEAFPLVDFPENLSERNSNTLSRPNIT